ncbi:Bug family tripartite tricarboxylate transporter substrate binding protein [Plastoroseomonas hellenica]|uniref:Bug family tripartite tricarboxylate transporter substrate binding protein n=1 Tax=Plastoroseomonas hellenica TaxID=2687306 RepID=UPI001BAB42E6|nr:tripartite tricarboxylate transporter substrate binding protein [Plastoroseomonas hellenica]MBR0641594.1 tripartite tricarboxylate transporter substrate binding protein [Plastoroseomonas hellenica]
MSTTRRQLGYLAASQALGGLSFRQARAQTYPARPIILVVAYGPGTGTDLLARQLGERMGTVLGQRLVVENRPGASGMIGTEFAARSRPDGYTLLFGNNQTLAVNVSLYRDIRYDPIRDFTPIARLASQDAVLVVNPRIPARSVAELVAYARANPDRLNFGSPGAGASAHLAGETFKAAAGIHMVHVPYNNAQLFADLLSGAISLSFYPYLSLKPHIASGALIPLATTGVTRSPWLPDLPTMIECGYPTIIFTSWFGLYGPAGLPGEITTTLSAAAQRTLEDPEVRRALSDSATRVEYGGPEELARFTASEIERYRPIIAQSGAAPG